MAYNQPTTADQSGYAPTAGCWCPLTFSIEQFTCKSHGRLEFVSTNHPPPPSFTQHPPHGIEIECGTTKKPTPYSPPLPLAHLPLNPACPVARRQYERERYQIAHQNANQQNVAQLTSRRPHHRRIVVSALRGQIECNKKYRVIYRYI